MADFLVKNRVVETLVSRTMLPLDMRAASRTARLLERPAWRTPRHGRASAARCVDASPKDAKRAAAGARRMEADAKTTAA